MLAVFPPPLLLLLLLTTVLSILTTTVNATDRPYWTEQASFVLGDSLYAIGIASNAETSEQGRRAAFERGLEEIKNFGQVDNLDGLFIETQRTFEESQANGSRVSVWRLLRVSIDGLRATANYQRMINATKPATTQVHTITITPQQDTPPSGAKAPPITTTDRPRVPTLSKPVAITRPPVVTQQQQEQQTILPTIPLRYPKVITGGWVRDAVHGLAPKWEDRPEWQGQIILPSYSIY